MKYCLIILSALMGLNHAFAGSIDFNLERCSKKRKYLYCESSKISNLSYQGKPTLLIQRNKNKTYSIRLELSPYQSQKRELPEFIKLSEMTLETTSIVSGDFDYYRPDRYSFFQNLYKVSNQNKVFRFLTRIEADNKIVLKPSLKMIFNDDFTEVKAQFSWLKNREDQDSKEVIEFLFIR